MNSDPRFTGRQLVLLDPDQLDAGAAALYAATSPNSVVNSAAFEDGAVPPAQAERAGMLLLGDIGVAVVSCEAAKMPGLRAAADTNPAILAIEPEQVVQVFASDPAASDAVIAEYLRGYKDAVDHLAATLLKKPPAGNPTGGGQLSFTDDVLATYGVQAVRAQLSAYTGRNVRVAFLDTGFDRLHPDFAGRNITCQSLVSGEDATDLNGHGTHCVGIGAGGRQLAGGAMRYGCASGCDIYAGKVLGNAGSGSDSTILAGINWAIKNGCRVVSMSLGSRVQPGEPYSQIYETVAQRALKSQPGTLLIAAAGNDSRDPASGLRRMPASPVSRPANCPSVLAVGAVDARLALAAFSNGGSDVEGGGVDVVAPGVDIFSSAPVTPARQDSANPWPARYHTLSGTSMATPYAAGVAAMWLEASPGISAQDLWQLLTGKARGLLLDSRDIGYGLVQAPGSSS